MADKQKPRLKNLDDLFDADSQPIYERGITNVTIDELRPFPNHPFSLYTGERLDDMVESIKQNGVLVPIIVRRLDGDMLQILAGHNRVCAARIAKLPEVPAIILENISDDEALVYVIETNVLQRGFSDMSHSEKAAVITLHSERLFEEGKRNDIIEHIKMLEYPCSDNENSDGAEFSPKQKTRDKVASEYGLSRNQVALYRRVSELIDPLQERLDADEFALSVASELSFLKDTEQTLVADCMELNSFKADLKKADVLRSYSDKGKLDDENVYLILSGEMTAKPKSARTPTVKIKSAVYSKYFTSDQTAKEVQKVVEKALEFYFANDAGAIFDALPGEPM